MFSVDKYLSQEYDFDANNCGHFVNMVWKDLTGEDIADICQSFISSGQSFFDLLKQRLRLKQPESPCVVIMHAFGETIPHAGVYVDGSVLHLTEDGAKFQLIELIKPFYKLSFYK